MVDIPVGMYRPHMNDIPVAHLPEGFTFRPFRLSEQGHAEDADRWVTVQAIAEAGMAEITRKTFEDDFRGTEAFLPDRSWFVVNDDGKEVASITAWWWDTPPDCALEGRVGLIHWVATLPECQGRGIGKAMMTKAVQRLAQDYPVAYLNTSTARLPAIRLYLNYGFLPDMKKQRAEEAWAAVREALKGKVTF